MDHCRTASPSQTASRRVACRPLPYSPSSAARCTLRPKRTRQMASTSACVQTVARSTFGVSIRNGKLPRNSLQSRCSPTTTPFLPKQREPYGTSSTASLIQPRHSASSLACSVLTASFSKRRLSPPQIGIDGNNLNAVEHSPCLGNVMSTDVTVSNDLNTARNMQDYSDLLQTYS